MSHEQSMSIGSAPQSTASGPTLDTIFAYLAGLWHEDTSVESSITKMIAHPAYAAITRLGPMMIPYILEDLRQSGGHWFPALRELTGENPVEASERGNFGAMRAAWLRWGAERGLVKAA